MNDTAVIRNAEETDLPAIWAIYSHYVRNSTSTFEATPPTLHAMDERMRKVRAYSGVYLVAADRGAVVGYAYAGEYRAREAYLHTVENSVYLHPDAVGRGIGRDLLSALIDACRERGFAQMVAVVGGGDDNPASIRLHENLGFRRVGTLERVGFKFGRWVDTVTMQRGLADPAEA